jgi:hypothetical protein
MRSALTHLEVRSLAVLPDALPSTPNRDERSQDRIQAKARARASVSEFASETRRLGT